MRKIIEKIAYLITKFILIILIKQVIRHGLLNESI